MSPVYRWYPVLQRYVSYVAGRVDGFGGDSTTVEPGLGGIPAPGEGGGEIGKPGRCVYEYIEANKNRRHYSILRFCLLALFLIVMGALAAVAFSVVDIKSPTAPTVVLWARIAGLLFTIMFFALEIFCDRCLCYFGHLAGDLEEVLGCRRIKLRQCQCPRGLFYSTCAMYVLLIIFWLVVIYLAA